MPLVHDFGRLLVPPCESAPAATERARPDRPTATPLAAASGTGAALRTPELEPDLRPAGLTLTRLSGIMVLLLVSDMVWQGGGNWRPPTVCTEGPYWQTSGRPQCNGHASQMGHNISPGRDERFNLLVDGQ